MADGYEVVVVGGGPAGVTAALRARELGASVALVERGNMGGTCTNDGCVPTRVLAHAARLVRDAEQFADYGLIGEPPRVDFARLLNRTQRIVYEVQEKKQLKSQAGGGRRARASTAPATRAFSDPHTLALGDGVELRGEKFILCAGGHARRLAFPGSEHALTHSDVWSMKRLPASVAVVGAAATGCQLASVFAAFGARAHAARGRAAHPARRGRGRLRRGRRGVRAARDRDPHRHRRDRTHREGGGDLGLFYATGRRGANAEDGRRGARGRLARQR